MTGVYNTGIFRQNYPSGVDPLVPQPVVAEIIQNLPTQSVMFRRAAQVPMSALTSRQPVLSVLPVAYFVGGDTGLKQTSSQDWENVILTAQEIAVIVPVPQAYIDDAMIPIWDQVMPRLVEAIGKLFDAAAIFGINKPSAWPTDIYHAAQAAGNVIANPSADLGIGVAGMGEKLAQQGYAINGFASAPGFMWQLVGYRTPQTGQPIYQPNLDGTPGGVLYGYGLNEVVNGSWQTGLASMMGGDWSKAIVGMRQDVSFAVFDQGVISDDSGNVVLNLMQQDSVAIRCVVRVAYATANPVTALQATEADRFPFAFLGPAQGLS